MNRGWRAFGQTNEPIRIRLYLPWEKTLSFYYIRLDMVDIRDVGACGYSGRVDAGSSETIDVTCEVRGGDIRNRVVVGRDAKEGI